MFKRRCEEGRGRIQNAYHRIFLVTPGSPMLGVVLSRKEGKIACEGHPLLILDTHIRTCRRGHTYRLHGLFKRTSERAVAHALVKQDLPYVEIGRLVVSRTDCHQWRVLAWIGVSTKVAYKGRRKFKYDGTYEGTVMFARSWGAGTFASRAKGGNAQVEFHDRLKGYSLSRRV